MQATAIDLFSANRSVQHNSFRWFYPFHANKIPVPHRWGIHAYVIEFYGVLAALTLPLFVEQAPFTFAGDDGYG